VKEDQFLAELGGAEVNNTQGHDQSNVAIVDVDGD
jgi:hypothetical protein